MQPELLPTVEDFATPPKQVHPAVDGVALVQLLRQSHTPPDLLKPLIGMLKDDPHMNGQAAYNVLVSTNVPEGTLKKARHMLRFKELPPLPVSYDPLDEVLQLRGEKAANPIQGTVAAADHAAALARIKELESHLDLAISPHHAKPLSEMAAVKSFVELSNPADKARIAELEALLEHVTSPAGPGPLEVQQEYHDDKKTTAE